ncbi:MAG: hypothetical protein GYA55_10560 [SAR324 cluster bacterium]|uniref:Carboxypeptidase regulatory-like domain-containing protein n=1 Tax=SAR324 cluster bacterium TaxID=2024889 RepID=A0A7X9FSN8_9DELT|nr:hypothetical protein [SAR324 cluster bacterium]
MSAFFKALIKQTLIVSAVFGLFLEGCGGGSSGTGSTRLFEGTVVTPDRYPISGATVTIADTGDTTTTDPNGRFSVEAVTDSGNVDLEIETGELDTSVTVPNLASDSSTVKVEVEIDPVTEKAEVEKFEVVSQIVGECGEYFNNGQIIFQRAPTPEKLRCTLRVTVNENGKAKGGVPFGLQYRKCAEEEEWITEGASKTLNGSKKGIGELNFDYVDDSEHCVYRIVTPFEMDGVEAVVQQINTLTKQAYDRG